jgi:hypothetical protein
MSNPPNPNPYLYGGAVTIGEFIYVKRAADTKLYDALKGGMLCCVFNARKAGKSSLRNNVMDQLISCEYEHKCVVVDLSIIGSREDNKAGDWYLSILFEINRRLGLEKEFDVTLWWNQHEKLTNSLKLSLFFEEQVLSRFQKPITVFIEEVDFVKQLPFQTDDLFVWIRGIYQKRSEPQNNGKYNRLNFCLLGVAKVSDLIKNTDITSFNLGQEIELTEFKLDDNGKIPDSLQVLITPELEAKVDNPEAVLKIVLEKTGGQPYLTLKLLNKIVQSTTPYIHEVSQREQILELIKKYITNKDDNAFNEHDYFRHTEQRIMNYKQKNNSNELTDELTDELKTSRLLKLYREILEGQEIQWNRNTEQLDLQLSGLVSNQHGILKPISPIHEEIFNLAWINECSNKIRSLSYQEKKTGWEKSNSDPSKRDRACLLYGDELTEAEQKYKKLSSEDEAFINTSSRLYEQDVGGLRDPRLKNLNDYQKKKIIDRLRYWTNYDKEIFDYLIIIINDNYDNNLLVITENDRTNNLDELVNNLVETKIIKCWHEISTLSRFDDQIKTQEENNFFSMLVVYGQILHQGKVSFSETDQHQEFLLKIGLVKKRYSIEDGYYIEVSNPILVHIFDKNYINEMLPNKRGYGKKLGMWLITQDDQYLLSAEELETIISFLAGESLPEEDHRFLIRSQISANST